MMNPDQEIDIVVSRGHMANYKNEPDMKKQDSLSTGTQGKCFEIHIKGHLDESWSDWLEGLEMNLLDNGEMILSGHIRDPAALMGVLNKLYGLNLTLLSLSEVGQRK